LQQCSTSSSSGTPSFGSTSMRETATSTELRRQALAQAYVATKGNVREAAEMAGYAYSSALQVLREPEFESRYLDPARRATLAPGLQAAQITAQRVMLELGRVAFSDIRKDRKSTRLNSSHQLI